MTKLVPSRMQVVRKQEKEPRLKDFIGAELGRIGEASGEAMRCLVVARSIDSPVLRALAGYATDLDRHSAEVRVILSTIDAIEGVGKSAATRWIAAGKSRWTRNARLADAHEFLVIGSSTSWVGDSMRRDPDKRDAFEAYAPSSPAEAVVAIRSFERLWQLCEPVSRTQMRPARKPLQVKSTTDTANPEVAAAAAAQDNTPVPGATRH